MLGTSHRPTGVDRGTMNIDDPNYLLLVQQLVIEKAADFIFEEATGFGPTTAERLALAHLGPKHYLDVDPPRNMGQEFGISTDTGEPYSIGPPPDLDFANWEFVEVHRVRETNWLQKIKDQEFKKALMICGIVHMLSFAFRPQSIASMRKQSDTCRTGSWRRRPSQRGSENA